MTPPGAGSAEGGPTERDLLGWMTGLSNWSRWGEEDQLGTLNLVTAEVTRRAGGLIRTGVAVSCAQSWSYGPGPADAPPLPLHRMLAIHDPERPGPDPDHQFAMDVLEVAFHSRRVTHLDSLAHCFWEGRMYNGVSSTAVSEAGAQVGAVDLARRGVSTRGVLVDVPYVRALAGETPGRRRIGIGAADLAAAREHCGVVPRSGDVLLLRAGEDRDRSGPLPELLPMLRRSDIAVLGSDTGNEVRPSGIPRFGSPVHQVGIVAMGLWILDAAELDELAAACRRHERWEFWISIAPLPATRATGSPVNPIAIF